MTPLSPNFLQKIFFLWKYDSFFINSLIIFGIIIGCFLFLYYVVGIKYLFTVLPGGRVSGDEKSTSFPSWLPVLFCLIGIIFYVVWKIDKTIFMQDGLLPDGSMNIVCQTKGSDDTFMKAIVLGIIAAVFGYVFWWRQD